MDFASVLLDPLGVSIDWLMASGDLASDQGLTTAVLISLFTDRWASTDELVAAGFAADADPRGWWADTPVDGSQPTDFIGSKLWLRRRVKLLPAVLAQIEDDIEEALAWMVTDGVAQSVAASSRLGPAPGSALFPIAIAQVAAGGSIVNHSYDLVWGATLALLPSQPPTLFA